MEGLFSPMPPPDRSIQPPLVRDYFFKDLQVMVARSQAGKNQGLYVAAKGGHNAESHNHNDVGHYIIYQNGQPMIIDAGVGTYTAKTFSPRRYEIWTMQSAFHSLPTIDSVMQQNGREFAARAIRYSVSEQRAALTLDLSGAYPAAANLQRWLRTVALERHKEVKISESYALSKPTKSITLSLLTPCRIRLEKPGKALLLSTMAGKETPAQLTLLFNAKAFQFKTEEMVLDDDRLKASWGDKLTRIQLIADNPPQQAEWVIRFQE